MLAAEQILDRAVEWSEDPKTTSNLDMTSVLVRATRQHDAELIWDMHERLSNDSVYFRYLGANKPSIESLQQLCSSGGVAGKVLVATVKEPQERVVAIACYHIDADNSSVAEPAVLVEDSYQGCGLGKRVMIALCKDAVQKGVKVFKTFIHPSNYRVMGLIQGSGLYFESKYNDGLKEIWVWLPQRS